jgi:transcription initiation factor TFIID subunit 7
MEEHFILRVPQSVAERLERVLNEDPSCANDQSLDLSFQGAVFLIPFLYCR